MSNKSLSDKSISGFIWLLGNSGFQSVLRVFFVAVLARLLTPADFGLMASGMLVVALSEMISQMGLGPALVQKRDLNDKHISTAFTLSVAIGVCLYLLFLLINPLIAAFFKMPALTEVLNILCMVIPLRIFTQVSYSSIQREFLFKKLAGWDALSYGIGYGGVGITLAYFGFGVYALVGGVLAQNIIYALSLFIINPHKLKIAVYRKELKELVGFGAGITISAIFNYMARNGDYFIVGRYLGAQSLGIYSRAYGLMNSANSVLGRVINQVLFVSVADIQEDREKLRRVSIKGFNLTFVLILPISVYCFFFAKDIVLVLLGQQWVEVILPFRIMVFAMIFRVGYKITGTFLRGLGRVYALSIIQFIYMTNILVGCYIFHGDGISAVAVVVGIVLFANFSLQVLYLSWLKYIQVGDVLKAVYNAIPLTVVVASVSWLMVYMNTNYFLFPPLVILLISILFFCTLLTFLYFKHVVYIFTDDGFWLIDKLQRKIKNRKIKNA